jgi:hypothetical protein
VNGWAAPFQSITCKLLTMKIFEFKSSGEEDYVVADDMFEAIKWYLEETSNHFDDLDNVLEMPKEDWGKHIVSNYEDEDNMEDVVEMTFAKAVEESEQALPYILASTAY